MGKVDTRKRVLLIDDDQSLLRILTMRLTHYGFRVDTATTGEEGFQAACQNSFDIIVLDMGLPDVSGMVVCHKLRMVGVVTPILVLSGDTSKETVVGGLRTGADDYLEKPFYKAELLARINALIRRNQRSFASNSMNFSGLQLDIQNCTLSSNLQSIKLTVQEAALLHTLMSHAPEIVSHHSLFSLVWGISDVHSSNRLAAYIKRLRQKLNQLNTGTTIETVYGKGYRLK